MGSFPARAGIYQDSAASSMNFEASCHQDHMLWWSNQLSFWARPLLHHSTTTEESAETCM